MEVVEMKMVFPNINYKEKAINFIKELNEYNSEIHGSGGLDRYLIESSYEDWLGKVISDIDMANINGNRVPALTYFYVRVADDKIIGMINIRLALNDYLRKEGGHIGYCILPTERNKHYGTMMLLEALKVCDIIGIKRVFVTCDLDNIPSSKVIKNCNGKLDEEFFSNTYQTTVQRYVIERDKI